MNEIYYPINMIMEENYRLKIQLQMLFEQVQPIKEENDKLNKQLAATYEHSIKPLLSENKALKQENERLRNGKNRKMKGRK